MESPVMVLRLLGEEGEHVGSAGGLKMLLPQAGFAVHDVTSPFRAYSRFWLWGAAGSQPTQPDSKPAEGN